MPVKIMFGTILTLYVYFWMHLLSQWKKEKKNTLLENQIYLFFPFFYLSAVFIPCPYWILILFNLPLFPFLLPEKKVVSWGERREWNPASPTPQGDGVWIITLRGRLFSTQTEKKRETEVKLSVTSTRIKTGTETVTSLDLKRDLHKFTCPPVER